MTRQSWYARLLRLRHTNLNGYLGLVLFEGTVAIAALLACAEAMTPWGVVVVPMAVAVMVKYHDVILGVLARPAAAAQLRRPRPRVAIGRSSVPRPSRPTTWIDVDALRHAPAAKPIDDRETTETFRGTGALRRNTAAMRMRENQGRFGEEALP
jgi:hypothetical protein